MRTNQSLRILAVGPLPPPLNGTSVSFQLFCDWINTNSTLQKLDIIDSSPRRLKDKSRSMPMTTLWQALRIFPRFCQRVLSSDEVLIFGSNGFLLLMTPPLLFVSKIARKPCYLRVFGGSLDIYYSNLNPIYRRLINSTLSNSDGIIVQTELLYTFCKALFGDKVYLIPGYRSIRSEEVYKSKSSSITANSLRLVFLGHIREEKGIFTLLKSLRQLYREDSDLIHCDIYGPVYESVSTLFNDEISQSPNATYKGIINPDEVISTLRNYDALVLPSHYQGEGHPGVLIEAMIAGIPVITTDFRSIPELVTDRKNGLLVSPRDSDDLALAIMTIFNDRSLLLEMGRKNWESREQFNVKRIIPLLLQTLGVQN